MIVLVNNTCDSLLSQIKMAQPGQTDQTDHNMSDKRGKRKSNLFYVSCFVLNDDNESCTQVEDDLESILINVAGNQRRKTKTSEAEMEMKKRKRKSKLFYVSCDYIDVHGIGSGIDLQVSISFELKDKLFLAFVRALFSITS